MSSDLWAAFGSNDPTTDTITNPWDEQKATRLEDRAEPDFHTRLEPQTIGLHTTPQGNIPTGDDHDSDADSWSAVNQELDNAWSHPNEKQAVGDQGHSLQVAPQGGLIDDEDDFGDFEAPESQPAAPISHAASTRNDPPFEPQPQLEDDFGDFEDPEEATMLANTTSNTSAPLPSPSVTANPSSRELHTDTSIDQVSDIQQDSLGNYDPFADLEQFSQAKASTASIVQQTKSKQAQVPPQKPKQAGRKAPLLEGIVVAEAHPDPHEEWDDFFDETPSTIKQLPPEPPSKHEGMKSTTRQAESSASATQESSQSAPKQVKETTDALPPTNIPPPSILIPLVSTIVQDLPGEIETILRSHEDYRGGMSALTQALGVLTALEDRVSVIKVAARILAGRKLRWKRDTVLAQSMSIGAAGRQGGMKLVGVDKAEVKREDREAAEFVRMWAKNSGRMRSALMKLPAQIDEKPPALPHIADTLLVRTLKDKDGGLKAPKSCVLCGLKREERVEKVDLDVWDQFGEWWHDYWGHSECRTFWNAHEQYLQQR